MAYKMTVVNPRPKGGRKMAKKKKGGHKKASKKSGKKRSAKQKAAFAKMIAARGKGKKKGSKKKKGAKKKKGGRKKKRTAKQKAATKRMLAAAAKKRGKKGGKKKASKKRKGKKKSKKRAVAKRAPSKPAKAKRARKAWPVGVPRPTMTRGEAVSRLGRAGKKLSKSRGVGHRKRGRIPGISSAARRMQMASQGVLQVSNPFEMVTGHPGMVVSVPGPEAKVRRKVVGVRVGKRSKFKYGRGSVGSIGTKVAKSKKHEAELDRIRRAAGIPKRKK
jgi:hypothetical protein